MLAELTSTKETALIRMLGVSAAGSDSAFGFLRNELLGKTVTVLPDPFVKATESRWNIVYIFVNDELFNKKILVQGHAKLNTEHWHAAFYSVLSGEASRAELESMGIWAKDNLSVKDFLYASSRININTANELQLQARLEGVDSILAQRIVEYRRSNPFQTVGDIKFVAGFTKAIYDMNHNIMVVSTNVADASRSELETLVDFTDSDIDLILDYREKKQVTQTTDLLSYILSVGKYDANKPFISTAQIKNLYYAVPDVIVNINTASVQQLVNAGMDSFSAKLLADVRGAVINPNPAAYGGTNIAYKRNYTLKTLGELAYFPRINYSAGRINSLADNLTLRTDINIAGYNELMSLNPEATAVVDVFSIIENRTYANISDIAGYISNDMFGELSKHLYVSDAVVRERVNINTANKEQMIAAGFSEDQAVKLIFLHKRMISSWDIPFDLGTLDAAAALYTNINTAHYNEIMSLNDSITSLIATDIISYRDNQPIGSMEELKQIFIDRGVEHVYEYIKDFIVLR